ncbi:acyl--CoA ligase (plasmid) [Leisingera sp. M527]|uniref:class I adenylate-forming enzyme family protein n=1 Tax=Leisingera sp. M527 TaxID=2867014 RepID=UPI0021A4C7EA|nr:class I adenylate-forming enzyme family protein [Leisingera sp. M527]UWQ35736.1 acyl--CoA ligase [Leisingera sp. M527]
MFPKRLQFILDRTVNIATLMDTAIAGREDEIFFTTDEKLPQYGIPDDGLTGAGLRDTVNRLCRMLHSHGVRRFDRVAIWKSNSLDYFLWSYSAMRRGAISVPVNGRMPVQNFLNFIRNSGARTIVTDCAGLQALQGSGLPLDGIDRIFLTDGSTKAPGIDVIPVPDVFAQMPVDYIPPHMDRDQHVMICHTSGTTGFPKGVLHGSDSFILAAQGQMRIQFITRRNPVMFAGWMNHHISQAGCITSLAAGVQTHVVTDLSAGHILQSISDWQPRLFFAFPDIYQNMCQTGLDGYNLSSVRMWMSSGDAMHEHYIRQLTAKGAFLRLFGKPLISSLFMEFFGTSEIGFAALVKISERRTRSFGRMVGRPTPASPAVKIADAEGRRLPAHKVGRMMVKGPTLFKGYWNQHDRTHDVVRDGWWWTGDVGFRDNFGRFYQIDRDVDTVNTAQGPVYGLPVEEEALKLPFVQEAALAARPASGADEAVLLLQMAPGPAGSPADLLAAVKANCSWAQHLSEVIILPEGAKPPRGLTGKVLKREIREQLRQQPATEAAQPQTPAGKPAAAKELANA